MTKVCVVGLGYIGLPTAAMFATKGFEVVGVDVNARIVSALERGEVQIQEAAVRELVREALASGRFHAALVPEEADAFVIAVPTPIVKPEVKAEAGAEGRVGKADLGYVVAAAESIVPYLRPGSLVVLESTSPPRTTEDVLAPILERSGIPTRARSALARANGKANGHGGEGGRLYVAHCPERVLPGQIVEELVGNDRIVGGLDGESGERAKALYASFVEGEIFVTDATTAEMVKLMENTYRDVNIALANELSLVAERVGIDVWEAIRLANRHPRVSILKPGPGVGGHCIAVDPWFIAEAAPEVTPLIQTARRVNDGMPGRVVERVKRALAERYGESALLAENRGKYTIACLGLAYKADVDDTRESPAVAVVNLLAEEGFVVRAYDPHARPGVVPWQVSSLSAATDAAQVVVLLTDHAEFRGLGIDALASADSPVVDTRRVLPSWRATRPIAEALAALA